MIPANEQEYIEQANRRKWNRTLILYYNIMDIDKARATKYKNRKKRNKKYKTGDRK